MKRPLVWVTLAFCLGVFTASRIRLIFFWVYILAILGAMLCLICFKKEKVFFILLFLLSFLLGVLRLTNSFILPRNHILKSLPLKGEIVYLEGIVQSDPIIRPDKTSFVLKAERLEADNRRQEVCGDVLVKISGKKGFFYGDKLVLEGTISKPFYSHISKKLNYRDYLRHKGIYAIFRAGKNNAVKKIKSKAVNPVVYSAFKIRQRLKDIVGRNLSKLPGSILNAVILGLREDLPNPIKEMLVNTGTVHIIAISGLHLGIVAFMVLIFLKSLRVSRRPRHIITVFILFFYCILTGANTPVIRATIMAAILLLGYIIKREADIYNSLCAAALIILSVNPWQIFEAGFQLSFLSVFFLVWLSPKINALLFGKLKAAGYFKFLFNLFSCSLAVWLGLFPLILYYFRIISPITVLANMLVVPYMTVVVACSFTFLLTGMVFPGAASLFSPGAEISTLFLLKFISLLDHIPLGHFQLS